MNFNRVIMMGRLTKDPELKYTASNTAILSASFVTNGRRKQGDEWVDEPCFIDITCFGALAERVSDKLHKGSEILIEGRLKQHRWEADDGTKRNKHEIVVDKLITTSTERNTAPSYSGSMEPTMFDEDGDIPF